MEDGATVPLFYEKRVPNVLMQNDELNEEFAAIVEDENLDEAAQEKLEKRFAQEMAVITTDDRLETIARDIVYDRALFEQKCAKVYDLVTEYSARGRKWAA